MMPIKPPDARKSLTGPLSSYRFIRFYRTDRHLQNSAHVSVRGLFPEESREIHNQGEIALNCLTSCVLLRSRFEPWYSIACLSSAGLRGYFDVETGDA